MACWPAPAAERSAGTFKARLRLLKLLEPSGTHLVETCTVKPRLPCCLCMGLYALKIQLRTRQSTNKPLATRAQRPLPEASSDLKQPPPRMNKTNRKECLMIGSGITHIDDATASTSTGHNEGFCNSTSQNSIWPSTRTKLGTRHLKLQLQ